MRVRTRTIAFAQRRAIRFPERAIEHAMAD